MFMFIVDYMLCPVAFRIGIGIGIGIGMSVTVPHRMGKAPISEYAPHTEFADTRMLSPSIICPDCLNVSTTPPCP
jgi:hypothetical protein